MIAKLRGILDSFGPDWAVIDVGGVGYLVFCPSRTLSALGQPGGEVSLTVETRVREDSITLYGFASGQERDWFRLLTGVPGVGAKVAMAILSVLSPDALAMAAAAQDKAALARADGVGPKLAGRIVSELKDKGPGLAAPAGLAGAPVIDQRQETGISADAVSALVNLGYGRSEAYGVVARMVAQNPEIGLNELIGSSLKALAK